MIFDLGCRKGKIPNTIGMDIPPHEEVDIVHDLNVASQNVK